MKRKAVILGAGLTGLTVGWKLSESHSVNILEKSDKIGGISSSFKNKDFILDYGPHKIYTQIDNVLTEIKNLLGEDLIQVAKSNKLYLKNTYLKFPLDIKELLFKMPTTGLKCASGYGTNTIKKVLKKRKDITYEDYILNRFGKEVYNLVFKPYAHKLWGDPKKLSAHLAETRVSMPNMITLVKNMLFGNKNKPSISAETFYYPKKGIIELSNRMQEKIKEKNNEISLNTYPKKINIKENKVISIESNKGKIELDQLVSTIPIDELILLLNPKPPEEVIKASKDLKYKSLILLYIIINKNRALKDNWIFFPEKEILFNRISEMKSFSNQVGPEGKTILTVEITCNEENPIWNFSDERIFIEAIKDLEKAGIIKRNEILDFFTVKIPKEYPTYDLNYQNNLKIILEYLDSISNLISIGRKGLFNYNNMDHCIDMGIVTANHIKNNGTLDDWKNLRKRFDKYRIVD